MESRPANDAQSLTVTTGVDDGDGLIRIDVDAFVLGFAGRSSCYGDLESIHDLSAALLRYPLDPTSDHRLWGGYGDVRTVDVVVAQVGRRGQIGVDIDLRAHLAIPVSNTEGEMFSFHGQLITDYETLHAFARQLSATDGKQSNTAKLAGFLW